LSRIQYIGPILITGGERRFPWLELPISRTSDWGRSRLTFPQIPALPFMSLSFNDRHQIGYNLRGGLIENSNALKENNIYFQQHARCTAIAFVYTSQ